MEHIIILLERKNLCYRNFYKLCIDFIDEIARGDTTNLELFQRQRGSLIKVLEQLETEINVLLQDYNSRPEELEAFMSPTTKDRITLLFKEKDGVVKSIIDIDLQILSHIDRIKDETIQRLQAIQSGKKTISAYKSPTERVEAAENQKYTDREA
jgi:hypothetical protein